MRYVSFLLTLAAVACGDGSATGPRDPASLHTQWVVESAPAGMTEAVVVDSAFPLQIYWPITHQGGILEFI